MNALTFIGIVPAAGIGSRMQSETPKQYLRLLNQTILEHSVYALLADPRIRRVVVALHANDNQFHTLPLARHAQVQTVAGGSTRAQSVRNALRQLAAPNVIAVVHDAARPCLRRNDLTKLLDTVDLQAQSGDPESSVQGAILAVPVRDTMKRVRHGDIINTEPRQELWHALTPQAFAATSLLTAIESAEFARCEITDEASAMERAGFKPKVVEASPANLKVTQPDDLILARHLLAN